MKQSGSMLAAAAVLAACAGLGVAQVPTATIPAASAPDAPYQPAAPDQGAPGEAQAPVLRSAQELRSMVSSIALYPDALLSQVLAAATYPIEIVKADRYVTAHPDLSGLEDQNLEASVIAVAHYPTVLKMMDDNIDWTTQLGEAFVNQQQDVMNAVQSLRQEAQTAGTLTSTPQQQVVVEPQAIQIIPADPETIYVPQYDPQVVFVDQPYYGPPLLSFGLGFGVGWWLDLDCDWHGHRVYYHQPYWYHPGFHPDPRHFDHRPYATRPVLEGQAWRRNPARPWYRPGDGRVFPTGSSRGYNHPVVPGPGRVTPFNTHQPGIDTSRFHDRGWQSRPGAPGHEPINPGRPAVTPPAPRGNIPAEAPRPGNAVPRPMPSHAVIPPPAAAPAPHASPPAAIPRPAAPSASPAQRPAMAPSSSAFGNRQGGAGAAHDFSSRGNASRSSSSHGGRR